MLRHKNFEVIIVISFSLNVNCTFSFGCKIYPESDYFLLTSPLPSGPSHYNFLPRLSHLLTGLPPSYLAPLLPILQPSTKVILLKSNLDHVFPLLKIPSWILILLSQGRLLQWLPMPYLIWPFIHHLSDLFFSALSLTPFQLHSCFRFFPLTVSSTWNTSPAYSCLGGSLISFNFFFKCHFFIETYPDNII